MWILFAAGSAFFAGITAVLAKCGIKKTDSDVATAIQRGGSHRQTEYSGDSCFFLYSIQRKAVKKGRCWFGGNCGWNASYAAVRQVL